MKNKFLRLSVFCIILTTLCAGIIFQYMTADKKEHTNAVLVMSYHNRNH